MLLVPWGSLRFFEVSWGSLRFLDIRFLDMRFLNMRFLEVLYFLVTYIWGSYFWGAYFWSTCFWSLIFWVLIFGRLFYWHIFDNFLGGGKLWGICTSDCLSIAWKALGSEYPSGVSICAWFLKCQFGSLLQTRKKSILKQTWFFVELEVDFYCLCSLQKSISKSNWFL